MGSWSDRGSQISSATNPEDDKKSGNLWGIILAGGEGVRVRHLMRRVNGTDLPKQYCAVIGGRSMLQHTLDRVATVIPRHRILTVITRDHLKRAREQLQGWPPELLVIQPRNRETAPGILLPLLSIHARDPKATVGIFPSDHFILEEGIFMDHVAQAVKFLATHRRLLILLGIAPDRPEAAYGWIEPSNEIAREAGYGLFGVRRFWEKPTAPIAERLYVRGWLWNSLVLVGRTRTFLRHFRQAVPELWANFESIRTALGTPREAEALEEAYRRMPAVNFSSHVLEPIPKRLGVMPAKGVMWSDWGDETRIFQTLQEIGKAEELTARLRGGGDGPWKETPS